MIRTIVVDDEWYNLEETCDCIRETGFMSVESCCRDAAEALREADRVLPQAAFIDIELPGMDGLSLAEKLLEKYPELKIVFITGWNQYAVAAFELNALDYIMKPLSRERFQKMALRLKKQLEPAGMVKPGTLTIRCFGGFEAVMNGAPVIWERIKAEELFAFLLVHHDAPVNKDVILENLWPDHERAKSLTILQTAVCKIRNIFSVCSGTVKLTYADNKYGLFLPEADCDYLQADNSLVRFRSSQPETFGAVEAVCEIFGKDLFAGCGYLWSEEVGEDMRRRLKSALRKISQFYRENSDDTRGLEALRLLARLSPDVESDQRLYLGALRAAGMESEAVKHEKWLWETLKAKYDLNL